MYLIGCGSSDNSSSIEYDCDTVIAVPGMYPDAAPLVGTANAFVVAVATSTARSTRPRKDCSVHCLTIFQPYAAQRALGKPLSAICSRVAMSNPPANLSTNLPRVDEAPRIAAASDTVTSL